MVQDSIKNWRWPLGGGEIGAVLVVNLNRARADQRNLLRMLLSKDDHGIVIIGTKHELGGANWVPQYLVLRFEHLVQNKLLSKVLEAAFYDEFGALVAPFLVSRGAGDGGTFC
ncbi:Glycerol 3-phosphate dehydrogenase [Trichinella pseudospiralis]